MNSLCSHHDQFTRATSDKRTERGPNPRYSFGLQTVYLLRAEPRAALDHATPLYTALGDTEMKAVSITSLSNLVRSIQIILKLQTSEQTPLMWKPGKTLLNKHITTVHHGFNTTTGTTCQKWSNVLKCF